MKVLIGITTRNRADILPKAIQSALDQSYSNKEVAVFDDASTDTTPDLKAKFPTVSWYRTEEIKGYLYARNKLMRETDADLYLSLDDDAWFIKKDEVAKGVALMQSQPDTAAIAYDILSPDKSKINKESLPYHTHMFIGCGHIVRLSAVKEVGYYTPNPGFYGCEEKDLSIQLIDRGYNIMFLPGVHIWHDKTTTARDLMAQHKSGVFNDLVFTLRRTPTQLVVGVLVFKLINHLRFARKNKLLHPFVIGVKDFFIAAPGLYQSVKPVKTQTFFKFRRLSQR